MSADDRMLEALTALRQALDQTGVPWMFIGGIAVIASGVARDTVDIDATLWGPAIRPEELMRRLARQKITPRRKDVLEIAKRSQVLLMRHRPTGVDLDIAFSWLPFERVAIDRAAHADFNGVEIRVAIPEDLIVYKAAAWRDRDRDDIERLLTIHADTIDTARVLDLVRQIGEALDDPQRVVTLEEMIRASR